MLYIGDIVKDLDEEFLRDFLDFIEQEIVDIEKLITQLEMVDDKVPVVNQLMQSLHNIKVNCRLVFLEQLESVVQNMENLVADLQQMRRPFTPEIGEILLLVSDEFKLACEDIVLRKSVDLINLEMAAAQLKAMHGLRDEEFSKQADHVLQDFAHHVNLDTQAGTEVIETPATDGTLIPQLAGNDDLQFFKSLAEMVDIRIPGWEGRSQVLSILAMGINDELQQAVDAVQLQAAVYMHDFGMGQYPDRLLEKRTKLSPVEQMSLQIHPTVAAELVERMPGWADAALYIRYHHERVDGLGYPEALKGEHIPLGARILTVVDVFWALTHQRSHKPLKKSVIRAATEIKRSAGTQLDEKVVAAFLKFLPKYVNGNAVTIPGS